MSKQKKIKVNGKEVFYPFRSLKSYKEMHQKTAADKGRLQEFQAAQTLTAARRVLFR